MKGKENAEKVDEKEGGKECIYNYSQGLKNKSPREIVWFFLRKGGCFCLEVPNILLRIYIAAQCVECKEKTKFLVN